MKNAAVKEQIRFNMDFLSEKQLILLQMFVSTMLGEDTPVIETDLTDEERGVIARTREEYANNPDIFVPLSAL